MPTYSYRCADCGHAFDIHQAFTDDSLTVCPECGGTLRKVFGNIGVTFSGSGFYRTDSRDTGSKKESPTTGDKGAAKSKDAGTPAASSGSAAASPSGGGGSSDSKSGSAAAS